MVWLLIGVIIGSVILDQLTKWLAVVYLKGTAGFALWDGVFEFTYTTNKGAAWGMLDNARWVFMTVSTLAIIGIAIYLFG